MGVVEPKLVGDQQQRGAEALDLKAARRLRAEALEHAVQVVRGERRHHGERHDEEDYDPEHYVPRPPAPPEQHARQRHEHERVDLRGDGEPEHAGPEQVVAAQE